MDRAAVPRARARARAAALVLAAALASACAAERPRAGEVCTTWQDDIGPLVAEHCTRCHGGDASAAAPAGGYDLTSYGGALSGGSDDVVNARAGDADAALVRRVDPATADDIHGALAHTHAALRDWVVICDVAYFRSPLHPGGILDPASADFHGATLAATGWDFALCASCHGEAFDGGTADAPCTTCHADGPTACTTCHGQMFMTAPVETPASGAHPAHAGAAGCDACHVVPARWDAPGHILADDTPGRAEIAFGALAGHALAPPADDAREDAPAYDPATGRCTGVFCHGATLGDAAATNTAPVWTAVGEGQAACGTCHGAPPASHADDRCDVCHPIDQAAHIDGVLTVGRGGGCSGCHGDEASPAPPADLAGNRATTAVGVGAHRSHVAALHGLRGPIPCADCHAEPAAVDSPGHIDSAAPAEVDATLGWDRAEARCQTSWCHGDAAPVWTRVGQDQAACGTCHGVPPADADHDPGMDLTTCISCHPQTVDAYGNIVRTGPPGAETSEHIDGAVDL